MSGETSASEASDEDGSHVGADPRDFEAVYADQADSLHAYAASILRGAGLIAHHQDVVQEAITGLWKRYKRTGQVPGSWTAVMMKEVKYRALDVMKLADVRHAGFSMDDDASTFEPAAVGERPTQWARALGLLAGRAAPRCSLPPPLRTAPRA